MPQEIQISRTPSEINLVGLEITQNECIQNSFAIAQQNPKTQIVEGLIIAIDYKNNAKPMCHLWNKIGDKYFDVTSEAIWADTETAKETKEIKYFQVKEFKSSDLKAGQLFEFSPETYEEVNAVNDILSWNEKHGHQ